MVETYGRSHKQWEIHEGGKYVIGSLGARPTQTRLKPETQIFIPDELVAPQHAILISITGPILHRAPSRVRMRRPAAARGPRGVKSMVSQINTSRMLGSRLYGIALVDERRQPLLQVAFNNWQLRPVGPVHMVQREPGESTPFFRMDLQIIDEHQSPISVDGQRMKKR